jgi:LuxR family maltose regulon positive regulatory protein
LAEGDLEAAMRWAAERAGLAGALPESATITEQLTYARMLVAQGEGARAIDLLSDLQASAAAAGRFDDLIRVCVLLSLAHLKQFELDEAVEVLQQALELGEANRYMRVFMDEGPALLRLLRVVQRRGIQVRYIQLLFAAAGAEPGNIVRITHRDLVEPITTREIEVLQLLGAGLTNREISDELVISVATTKRHISNLYGKLSVSSRSEAVQRARKLGLFANEQSASSHAATDDAL